MPASKFADDRPALDYIRKRGYASYSSIKMVRDCEVPGGFVDGPWFAFGKELHSRDLEKKKIATLTEPEEKQLAAMLKSLDTHAVYQRLKRDAKFEIPFGPESILRKYKEQKTGLVIRDLHTVPVYGRIDILNLADNHVSDLKSTREKTMKGFAESMDFLQAALYLAVTRAKDFYYVGICKQPPYNVMVFSVAQYPDRLRASQKDLTRLLKHINKNL